MSKSDNFFDSFNVDDFLNNSSEYEKQASEQASEAFEDFDSEMLAKIASEVGAIADASEDDEIDLMTKIAAEDTEKDSSCNKDSEKDGSCNKESGNDSDDSDDSDDNSDDSSDDSDNSDKDDSKNEVLKRVFTNIENTLNQEGISISDFINQRVQNKAASDFICSNAEKLAEMYDEPILKIADEILDFIDEKSNK